MRRFINRHMGVPEPVADIVTTDIAKSLRSYFLAVTIIAAFNAVLIGGAALVLVAGTIAVVTFVGAYVPFVMSATLSLNPLVVLVVTIGAGALFGMVGLTLAAPLTSAAVHIANELRSGTDAAARAEPAPTG